MEYPKTLILRHRRENLKKCSLRGLESRSDMEFLTYPRDQISSLNGYILLSLNAPELTSADRDHPLFILDGTWRYAERMMGQVPKVGVIYRSLPSTIRTAYPRKQEDCADPERGLASIEAIYAAYRILGRPVDGLLDHYFWKEQFLELNPDLAC